jgi:hypothetical protein
MNKKSETAHNATLYILMLLSLSPRSTYSPQFLNTFNVCHIPKTCDFILKALIMFMDGLLITNEKRQSWISQCHKLFH